MSNPDSSLVPQAEALAKALKGLARHTHMLIDPETCSGHDPDCESCAFILAALQRVQAETREEAVKIAETVDPRIPTAAALADVIQRLRARKDRP